MEPFRLEPNMPVGAYRTFQIASPIETHWRPATCEESDCEQYANGWRVRVEGLSPEDLHAIRTSGRQFRQVDVAEGETWLVFEPGQRCFKAATHKVPLGRPELYVVRDGDWRGNPTRQSFQHSSAESWVDQFATHQDKLAEAIERA
jgi:hypothetical protein